jgi:hypothetical protein
MSHSHILLALMAAARAVVAAAARLIAPASAGLLCWPGDVSAITAAILRLSTTPTPGGEMATRARQVTHRQHVHGTKTTSRQHLKTRKTNMRNPMGLLLLWIAELLDRSMIAVPDVELPMPSTARSTTTLGADVQFPTIHGAGNTQSVH